MLWARLLAGASQAAEHARWLPRNGGKIDRRSGCYDLRWGCDVPISQSCWSLGRAWKRIIQHTPRHRGRGLISLSLGLPFSPGGQLRVGGVAESQHGEGAMFGGFILNRGGVWSVNGVMCRQHVVGGSRGRTVVGRRDGRSGYGGIGAIEEVVASISIDITVRKPVRASRSAAC